MKKANGIGAAAVRAQRATGTDGGSPGSGKGHRRRKRWFAILLPPLALAVLLAAYFLIPLPASAVLPSSDSIESIYIDRIKDGAVERSRVSGFSETERFELGALFRTSTFRRRIGGQNVRNDGETLLLTVVLTDHRNYELDVNEHGAINSRGKIYRADARFYEGLRTWLRERAEP
ncbi:hypothetical protein [Paenibacillus sp. GCM10023250]|uniref:hypothetical protein n=1 Tax=Paenibacillus sp. GCM10023250 TaxID=3252648 RepID=UPI00361A744B